MSTGKYPITLTYRKSIAVHPDIYKRLKSYGRFGESFSDLVNRLLDEIDAANSNSKRS